MEILGGLVICIFLLCFFVASIGLTYNRYIRTYKSEIREYLAAQKINYIETNGLNKLDRKRNPFRNELYIQIGNYTRGIKWTKYEYLIVIGEKNKTYQEYWLELKTTYFRKPKLVFKAGRIINYEKDENTELRNENCPNCSFMLFNNNDLNCPNCGVSFL